MQHEVTNGRDPICYTGPYRKRNVTNSTAFFLRFLKREKYSARRCEVSIGSTYATKSSNKRLDEKFSS